MGATLGCLRGSDDQNGEYEYVSGQYQSMGGRRSSDEKSQHSTSRTLQSYYHYMMISPLKYTTSRYDSEEEEEMNDTQESITSGSRLLHNFYNLVLECEHSKFFIDQHGKPIQGVYPFQVYDNYFGTKRVNSPVKRRQERDFSSANTWSTISSNTTISSDVDYWNLIDTCMDTEPILLFSPFKSKSCSTIIKSTQVYNLELDQIAKITAARRKSITHSSHTVMPVAS